MGHTISRKFLGVFDDLKLGFMVSAVGMGAFVAGMFHLVHTEFFKALLFLLRGFPLFLALNVDIIMREHAHHGNHGRSGRIRKNIRKSVERVSSRS